MAFERKKSKKEVEFCWNDDELQLLLQAALDCKAKCEFNAENWESKRQKSENIFDIFLKEYPDEKEKYPIKGKMTKAAKLKSIQSAFKKAIDCSKKGMEVVWFYFFRLL